MTDSASSSLTTAHPVYSRSASMRSLSVAGVNIAFIPDEGDAGGRLSYLSTLNSAFSTAFSNDCPTTINTVGWYAQTYQHEEFTGFQLMPQVDDIKTAHALINANVDYVYEASVMPYESWVGYTSSNDTKAQQVAKVMKSMLDRSRNDKGEFTIKEIRLRFGHEMNYYISAGTYPPPTNANDAGADYREAFNQVALACRALPLEYKERVKMFWCPNIASTSSGALKEYSTYLPNLDLVDYVGIDYYCPSPGNLSVGDFVRKMKVVHDKWASPERPFILGETGLHFEEGGMDAKLKWLDVITSQEARKGLGNMVGLTWFNYEKDLDYRLLWVGVGEASQNEPFANWVRGKLDTNSSSSNKRRDVGDSKGKVKRFFKTLIG